MDPDLTIKYREFLTSMVSENRKERIEEVLLSRTRFLTVVLEDIYQTQNASAVVRTCECLGIQDIHIVENRNLFEVNRDVVRGASKWVDIHRYNEEESTKICFDNLRQRGYQIVGTAPEKYYESIADFLPETKIALVFGTELEGLSEYAINNVDKIVRIPMVGFTESLNLSVSAAICIETLVTKIKESNLDWSLDEIEKNELRTNWYQHSIRMGDKLYYEFMRLNKKGV